MKSEKEKNAIFSDKNAFRRKVSLALVQVEGLAEEELATALAYELEPYSMIPAADAAVAWRDEESPDRAMRVFDVAVVRRKPAGASSAAAGKWMKPLAAAAVVAIAAMACDYARLASRAGALEESLAARAPLQAELDSISARTAALKREASSIRSARERAAAADMECAGLRAAYPAFFDALSVAVGRVVVGNIAKGAEEFSLALTLAAADGKTGSEAVCDLAREASSRGWEFSLGDITASDGGLARFDAAARLR